MSVQSVASDSSIQLHHLRCICVHWMTSQLMPHLRRHSSPQESTTATVCWLAYQRRQQTLQHGSMSSERCHTSHQHGEFWPYLTGIQHYDHHRRHCSLLTVDKRTLYSEKLKKATVKQRWQKLIRGLVQHTNIGLRSFHSTLHTWYNFGILFYCISILAPSQWMLMLYSLLFLSKIQSQSAENMQ